MAALNADLPALRPLELARVLEAAAEFPRAFLPDAAAIGTTLLAASPDRELLPAFGTDSRARHRASGAVELLLDATWIPYARTWTPATTCERHWHSAWARARRRRCERIRRLNLAAAFRHGVAPEQTA